MNCTDAFSRILDHDASPELEAHLRTCASCRQDLGSLEQIAPTLATPEIWEDPAPSLAASISAIGKGAARPLPARLGRYRAWIPAAVTALIVAVAGFTTFDRPDWEMALVPVGDGLGASAAVSGWNESGGTRMQIRVSGVEPSPSGHYYEIWLTSPTGLHVSGGTFAGDGVLSSVVGVRRADFPRIWITLEPMDSDGGPSPNTYFDSSA